MTTTYSVDLTPIVDAAARADLRLRGLDDIAIDAMPPALLAEFKQACLPLVIAVVDETRKQLADGIGQLALAIEMSAVERPLAPGAETPTDFADDLTWAAMLVRGGE